MAIISKLISRVDASPAGTTINTTLKSGTRVRITKLNKSNTIEVVRKNRINDGITTILKKIKGIYQPKKVIEEYRFGIVTIDYKKDGSRLVQIRSSDKDGTKSSKNNGFFKTTVEENLFPKGAIIKSLMKELQTPHKERNASISFLQHLGLIRRNNRYKIPTANYSVKQDLIYEEVDLKKCKKIP